MADVILVNSVCRSIGAKLCLEQSKIRGYERIVGVVQVDSIDKSVITGFEGAHSVLCRLLPNFLVTEVGFQAVSL